MTDPQLIPVDEARDEANRMANLDWQDVDLPEDLNKLLREGGPMQLLRLIDHETGQQYCILSAQQFKGLTDLCHQLDLENEALKKIQFEWITEAETRELRGLLNSAFRALRTAGVGVEINSPRGKELGRRLQTLDKLRKRLDRFILPNVKEPVDSATEDGRKKVVITDITATP